MYFINSLCILGFSRSILSIFLAHKTVLQLWKKKSFQHFCRFLPEKICLFGGYFCSIIWLLFMNFQWNKKFNLSSSHHTWKILEQIVCILGSIYVFVNSISKNVLSTTESSLYNFHSLSHLWNLWKTIRLLIWQPHIRINFSSCTSSIA